MVVKNVVRKTRTFINTEGEAHFATFTCFRRRAFLSRDRTRGYFLQAIEKMRSKHSVHLWAYVVMPEHAHLLLFPTAKEYEMDAMLTTLKLSVSRRALAYLRNHNARGLKHLHTGQKHTPYRFWMPGGGYDRNTITFSALGNMVQYIHNNPVRRGLVENPLDWSWSSAREWDEEGTGLIRLDRDSFPFI